MNTQPCVFIVVDDAAVRDGLGMVLETVGLAYQAFENAERFLECYVPATPGCLLVDMNMLGMNGDELQAELLVRNIHLPIISLTSYGELPATVRIIKTGTEDFITKPIQIKQLIEHVQASLNHEIGN
jgi:FixJ family two-component response regulator